ncbi:MAG TPA: pseudouridine synthase, partial [Candidatus Limnocylindria bacterium]|nr:pseudouridine synthase [Candidatus Limnocylindria bacterium]
MRIDRLLALAAGMSRTQARDAIRAGRVLLDGKPDASPKAQAEPGADVRLDGHPLDANTEAHLMLNKPAGVLTAARDPKQPTVMGLLPARYARIGCMPVGRLDKDSEGLLLLTTDGELAHLLLSPRREISKEYLVRASGRVDEADVDAFRDGVALSDFTARPAALEIISTEDGFSVCRV